MNIRSAFLALALVAASGLAQAQQPFPPSSDEALEQRVAALIPAATRADRSPERQAARDALFREIKPRLLALGWQPGPADAAALTRALGTVPCVSGRPRLVRAVVHGQIAYVAAAGERGGGCTYLLRRDGERWTELLPLGWTLNP